MLRMKYSRTLQWIHQSQIFGNLPATQVAMLSMSFVSPDDGLALPIAKKNLTCIPTTSCKYFVEQVTLTQDTVQKCPIRREDGLGFRYVPTMSTVGNSIICTVCGHETKFLVPGWLAPIFCTPPN